jgi:hypothetical protein
LQHFVLHCSAYDGLRKDMLSRLRAELQAIGAIPLANLIDDAFTSDADRLALLLGSRLDERDSRLWHPDARTQVAAKNCQLVIHKRVSNFLMLAWRERERLIGFPVLTYDRVEHRSYISAWERPIGKSDGKIGC